MEVQPREFPVELFNLPHVLYFLDGKESGNHVMLLSTERIRSLALPGPTSFLERSRAAGNSKMASFSVDLANVHVVTNKEEQNDGDDDEDDHQQQQQQQEPRHTFNILHAANIMNDHEHRLWKTAMIIHYWYQQW